MLRNLFSIPRKNLVPDAPKLNLGCGLDYRDGYINIDFHAGHRVDMVADVAWLKEIEDQTCAEAVAQDVLEHLPRAKSATALREWNRVLQMGGRLTLRIPSLIHQFRLMSHPDWQSYEKQAHLIRNLFGTQGYEGDFHLNGFTEVTLRHELGEAGFELTALDVFDDWLFDVEACKVRHVAPDPILRAETDAEFLKLAYLKMLGREIDPSGLGYYCGVLGDGIARETVVEILKNSDEYRHMDGDRG